MCRYGMLISVLRKEKADFDGLLAFYKSFINPKFGLMKWQVRSENGSLVASDDNSATDGDMDAAYALFKAGACLISGCPQAMMYGSLRRCHSMTVAAPAANCSWFRTS